MGKRSSEVYPGAVFGEWTVLEYVGKSKWLCKCSCGTVKEILTGKLTSGQTKSCGHNKLIDLTGQVFGEWTVLEYVGNMYWKCRCSCGNIKNIHGRHLRDGVSKNCGHNGSEKRIDLTGKQFGEYTVLGYAGNKEWLCRCSCGREKIIQGYRLRNGEVKSCGHTNRLTDIIGKRFGKLLVKEYVGNRRYKCQCDCGNITEVLACNLLNESTKSCGCLAESVYTKELILKNMDEFKQKFGCKPFKNELAEYLGISYQYIIYLCNKYGIDNDKFNNIFGSLGEKQIYDYIKTLYKGKIELHNRKLIPGMEIDIYIPDLNIAIEYNGVYWHQSKYKDKYYHQNKTITCAKRGIRLIHIFDYEWKIDSTQTKILNLLKDCICNDNIVYARNCEVRVLNKEEEKEFTEKYHLQGYTGSKIALGLLYNNDIISLMSFGTPRFNSESDWELIRFCNKTGYKIIGGAEKLFKHFIELNNPTSVVTYSDIAKFTGNVYTRMGFKTNTNSITEPSYVWVKTNFKSKSDILSRYQTQKQKLLDRGLGEYGDTEDEIMENLGYIKIYDSGNIRLTWNKN